MKSITFTLITVFIILALLAYSAFRKYNKCEATGGVLVHDVVGYVCIKAVKS
jgi:hypothetical protein